MSDRDDMRGFWFEEAARLRAEILGARLAKLAGTQRSVPSAQTLARLQPIAAQLGITRLANITGLDCVGIPVIVACRPNARGLATSQGKGLDVEAAKASALMEAVERQQAERVVLPLRMASYHELSSVERVIDIYRLPAADGPELDAHRALLWAPGVDLLRAEPGPTWVPYEVLHTDWSLPGQPATGSFAMSANGLASGNHVLEAVVHGLCEVVERDAQTVLTCAGEAAVDARRVDLATIDAPICSELLARFERAGVAVAIWDATSDVGLPTYIALIADRDVDDPRGLYAARGSGTHPNRAVALSRALTEAAQSRLSFVAGSRDDILHDEYREVSSREMALRTMEVIAKPCPWSFGATPTHETNSVEADLQYVLERLTDAGFDSVVVADLRRPELAIPIVRVLVPGLEADLEDGAQPGIRAHRAAMMGARA